MKIQYTLETLQEFKNAASNVRQENDPLPAMTGILEMQGPTTGKLGEHWVELVDDQNFKFSMKFKDFVIEVSEMAGVELKARDLIPE